MHQVSCPKSETTRQQVESGRKKNRDKKKVVSLVMFLQMLVERVVLSLHLKRSHVIQSI